MFKNKTLAWKTPKPNFVAFFVLIGMAFSFISELSGNQDAMLSISCRIFLDWEPIRAREILFNGLVYANGNVHLPGGG